MVTTYRRNERGYCSLALSKERGGEMGKKTLVTRHSVDETSITCDFCGKNVREVPGCVPAYDPTRE